MDFLTGFASPPPLPPPPPEPPPPEPPPEFILGFRVGAKQAVDMLVYQGVGWILLPWLLRLSILSPAKNLDLVFLHGASCSIRFLLPSLRCVEFSRSFKVLKIDLFDFGHASVGCLAGYEASPFGLWAVSMLDVELLTSPFEKVVDDEREFTYELDSERGPNHWGEIKAEWSMCNSGGMQSPIDLMDERVETVSNLGRLNRDYKPSNATLKNRGHDMVLRWASGAGHIHINGTQFVLKQLHWHSPSEHSINGKRFDMELHLVHESAEGKSAVVAIMYKIGRPDSFLKMIENYLESLAETIQVERDVGVINPVQIAIGSRKYYRYIGSLTVPPCTQNVVWTIVRKVRTVTREQVKLIRDAVHDESETNARPIQPMNQRSVKLFRPEDQQGN